MTNGEKYKTAEERSDAFRHFCGRFDGCGTCSLRRKGNQVDCVLNWLNLKASIPLEKPMKCPHCGDMEMLLNIQDCGFNFRCTVCAYKSPMKDTEEEAIAAHNRICRAVAAYKESEVE